MAEIPVISQITLPSNDVYNLKDNDAARASHTHGNLANNGVISSTTTIANGDKLVIIDANSDPVNKITGSSITFGTSTAQWLNNSGKWSTPTAAQVGALATGYTYTASLAADTGTPSTTLEHNGTYKLTAGGQSVIFKLPPDNNTTYTISGGTSSGQIKVTPSSGNAYDVSVTGLGTAAYTSAGTFSTTGHTHDISITTTAGAAATNLSANTQYNLNAGGSSITFKTPSDSNNAVTQTATTTSAAYEVLLSGTADNTSRTEGAKKTSTLTYNPSTKALVTGGTINGIALAEAASKTVATSISEGDTAATLPTAAAVASFIASYTENKGYVSDSGVISITPGNGLITGTTGTAQTPITSSGTISIKEGGVTNDMLAGSIANGKLSNSKITIAGSQVSLGGSISADTLRSNLGLSNAMHYRGAVDANPISTAPSGTYVAGDVVTNSSKEFVYDGTNWRELGDESSFKIKQTAVNDPTASGNAISFIDTISQSANGAITVTKKTVPDAATDVAHGLITNGSQTLGGTKTFNGGVHFYGTINMSGSGATNMYHGGVYHANHNTIVLHGDASGISGIGFTSQKATDSSTITNINSPSDRAFIQYHAYGVTTPSGEGTAPALATSGEAGVLAIGVGNDATDTIRLQAPGAVGILHQIGNTAYPIPHTSTTSGTVGGAKTPVYVSGGIITAGDALKSLAYKDSLTYSDVGAAAASHNHDALTKFVISTYDLSAQKGVRIQYPTHSPVLIMVSTTLGQGRLVLVGGGYGATIASIGRNDFTEVVSPSDSILTWSIPQSEDYSCCVEVLSHSANQPYKVTVWTSAICTFTQIDALTTPKQNRTLLTSANYTTYAATKNHSHGNMTSDGKIGSTANYAVYTTAGGSVTASSFEYSSPTTTTETATSFISAVTQDSKGQISASIKNLPTATTSVAGITKVGASGGAAAYSHGTHVSYGTSAAAVGSSSSAGSSSSVSRSDHVHSITVGSGDNNGQVKIAGQNADVTGLKSGAFTTAYSHPTSAGNKHLPSGGADGNFLKYGGSSGTGIWSNIYRNDIKPLVSKTYTNTSFYGSDNSNANCSFYFMSVKPDAWVKPWTIRFKIRSYCPSNTNGDSITYCTLSGRADAMIYHNWNEHYETGHTYIAVHILKSAGFTAGLGHAIGINMVDGWNRTNSSYYRTFELDYYECENCTVTILEAPVKWASWTNGSDTNYNGYTNYDAYNRGLRESGDDNSTSISTFYRQYGGNVAANLLCRYQFIFENAEHKFVSLYGTDNAYNTTNKVLLTVDFDPNGRIYYHNTTGTTAANANIDPGRLYYSVVADLRYTFNVTSTASNTTFTGTRYTPLYLRTIMTVNTGMVHVDGDQPLTTTLPTSNDGKYYIYLGQVHNWYQVMLESEHPVYYHNGTEIVRYYGKLIGGTAVAANIATTANNLGTANKGTSTKPIYLVAGAPNECSTYAGGTAVTLNNVSKAASTASFYAPTGGGTTTQALMGNGTTTAPKWTDVSPSVTIGAGTGSSAPTVKVTVLGQDSSASSITTATTSIYGVTKLQDGVSSTSTALAATAKAAYTASRSSLHSVNNTAKFFVTGCTSSTDNTASDNFDTGVYITNVAGEISALRHSWNYSSAEKAYTYYNNTDNSIDFVFN